MTTAQLSTLRQYLSPPGSAWAAGVMAPDLPDLAEVLGLPWSAYESRPTRAGVTAADDHGIACRPAAFSLVMVGAAPADEGRTLGRLAFAHRVTVTRGVLLLDIHPGDVTHAIARHLTTCYDPVYSDTSIIVGVRKPLPDNRSSLGAVPRGTLAGNSYLLPVSPGPGATWTKLRPTEDEIAAWLASQETTAAPAANRPPLAPLMPLAPGHLAQALGTGLLDGPVTLADGRRAVIRGFAGKSSYKKSRLPLHSNGNLCDTTQVVYGERPHLWVRLVDEHGRFESHATESD